MKFHQPFEDAGPRINDQALLTDSRSSGKGMFADFGNDALQLLLSERPRPCCSAEYFGEDPHNIKCKLSPK